MEALVLLTSVLVDTVIPYSTNTKFIINNMAVLQQLQLNGINARHVYCQNQFTKECTVGYQDNILYHFKTHYPYRRYPVYQRCHLLIDCITSWRCLDGPGINNTTGLIPTSARLGDGPKVYNYVYEKGSSCELKVVSTSKSTTLPTTSTFGADTAFVVALLHLAPHCKPGQWHLEWAGVSNQAWDNRPYPA